MPRVAKALASRLLPLLPITQFGGASGDSRAIEMGLLDFPCGRRDVLLEEDTVATPAAAAAAAEWASPEKRRRRAASRGSGSLWRPSLLAISEDAASGTASPPTTKAAVAAKGAGSGKGKGKAKAKGKPATRTAKFEYQNYGVVPTFSPTAFLF